VVRNLPQIAELLHFLASKPYLSSQQGSQYPKGELVAISETKVGLEVAQDSNKERRSFNGVENKCESATIKSSQMYTEPGDGEAFQRGDHLEDKFG